MGVASPEGPTEPLKPLSPSYIKERAKDPNLSSMTAPGISNLTRTGEMLDSLAYKVKKDGLTVTIFNRQALLKAIWTNETRPWVNLSKDEAELIASYFQKLVEGKTLL